VFKCPADNFASPVQRTAFGITSRCRSLSGNIYLGEGNYASGPTDPLYKQVTKLSNLTIPGPSKTWVFLDEHPDSINDAGFFPPHKWSWVDVPATYHNGAGGLSFADGHSEIHKWRSSLSSGRARQCLYLDMNNGEISGSGNDKDISYLGSASPNTTANNW
jgi:prepilin-type processing-associated H-X9-DG protein